MASAVTRPLTVAAFYRFMALPAHRELRDTIDEMGRALGIKGTILVAAEGVNGSVSGEASRVELFLDQLADLLETDPFAARVSTTDVVPFRRWRVRVKKEIVTIKSPAADPLAGVGHYVDPEDWNALIERPDVAVVDVRNRFEIEYGTFPGAIDPETDDFSDFPRFVAQNLPDPSQPVALFCTGGIRCEKATAYLIAQGFKDVNHLRGGILGYLESIPEGQSRWEGACFIFDDRIALDQDLKPIASCKDDKH